MRPLTVGEQVRGRLPRDHALDARVALQHRADVDAVPQQIIAGELELVQERHVEVALIAEPAALRHLPALVQVGGRRTVRVVV